MKRLVEDNPLDRVLQLAATLRHRDAQPEGEIGADLERRSRNYQEDEAGFIGEVIRNYLRWDGGGMVGSVTCSVRPART